MKKVAVFGACPSRDIFNSKFIKNYKNLYECVATIWQTSIISFMSEEIVMEEDLREFTMKVSKLQKNTTIRDREKSYRKELIDLQPDYILLDLYTDVKYGVVKTDHGYLTNNPNGFRKTVYFKNKQYNKSLNIFRDNEYLDLFYEKFSMFMDWVKKYIPDCIVIINGFNQSYSYLNKENYPINFSPNICKIVAKDNMMYNKIYSQLTSIYDVYLIDMRNQTYFGKIDHIYGNKPWHFSQQYYDDLYKKFNEVVLENEFNKKKSFVNPLSSIMKTLRGSN
ncbi:hypothetical protein GCM10011391_37230 [Pullulanibacillus camelliae]|uniref:Uncharacterized protein n=1 Tax=Pullulanibacillus camelliae TaxID=1707096 RepID=A0A8J2YMN3_9BACL|nr:DUF6270 domain-containing protein [Pullulanibacillus camelliae]GGE54809.1 hypothetical protein GCM10011391_37230 [Pullulanibacillus camelliae]